MTEFGTRRLVGLNDPPPFNPRTQAKFRDKFMDDLTREELIEALDQALRAIHALNQLR